MRRAQRVLSTSMSFPPNQLELLAPARSVDIAREAILHGADAVYIGGPAFGARHNAGNPVSEIDALATFAHRFHARVYVTINTILHDDELEAAQQLTREVYEAGADALIIQDMGLLELELPPIALHASTQCDIRTPDKALFLAQSGFSQIVLARELSLDEIAAVRAVTPPEVTLEYFVHGALCVAYSGQCYLSHAQTGRSANRGDCSQACRLPYTLQDAQGRIVAHDRHLLSLKDNNQGHNLAALIDAGIRSFKIEGRLKDMAYVKNIASHYRRLLDDLLTARPDLSPSSSGRTELLFTPDPDKSFHREHTDYFVHGRQQDIGAFESPKFIGPQLGCITRVLPDGFELETEIALNNGDGLNYLDGREAHGTRANVATLVRPGLWRVQTHEPTASLQGLRVGVSIHRNHDQAWEQMLAKPSALRRVPLDMTFAETQEGFCLHLADEEGTEAIASVQVEKKAAHQPERFESNLRDQLCKLGNTIFQARSITLACSQPWFLPNSQINALRREAVAMLDAARLAAHVRLTRRQELTPPAIYPQAGLTYLANVYNTAARRFYTRHGVTLISAAYEAHEEPGEVSLMVTKHCLRHAFNLCPKQARGIQGLQGKIRAEPMTLVSGADRFILRFDCKACEMHLIGTIKKHVLRALPPGASPLHQVRRTR